MTTHTFTLNVRHDVCQTCGYAADHELHTGERPETTVFDGAPSRDAGTTHTGEPTRCTLATPTGRCMLNAGHDAPCYRGAITPAVLAAVNARGVVARDTSPEALAAVRRAMRSGEVIA